jgi:hypothetical protein
MYRYQSPFGSHYLNPSIGYFLNTKSPCPAGIVAYGKEISHLDGKAAAYAENGKLVILKTSTQRSFKCHRR